MTGYLLRRLMRGVVTVLVSITITFLVLRVMPGDPALLLGDTRMTEELRQQIHAQYGLDKPLVVQYLIYLWDLVRGDLGTSFRQLRPVIDILLEKIPWTLLLAGASFAATIALGVPLGVAAALRRGSWPDRLVNAFAVTGHAVFVPWLAITLLYFFGYQWGLFPIGGARALDAQGWQRVPSVLHHLVLPSVTLVLVNLVTYVLFMRTSMIETLQEDYVRTARAKGAAPRAVIYRHALRNAILPTLTMMGLQLGHLVGGAVLTETVFAYPGVGRLIYDAVRELDYPVLQGAFIILAVTVVLANVVTDLAYGLFDPRIEAARALGGSDRHILLRHLLPVTIPVIVVNLVLSLSRALLSEAGLSFLGLGDPLQWSWGRILQHAQRSGAFVNAWWQTLFPSLAIMLFVVSTTFVGTALNDVLNPRLQRRS